MINKTTGYIDFSKSADEIYNLIRALNPYPYAQAMYEDVRFKVIGAKISDKELNAKIGEITDVSPDGITVSCGSGSLLITDVQFEGKKKMPVAEFIKGNEIKKGVILKCPNL